MTTTHPARHTPRVEDEALVRGNGRFSDDPRLPNQAYAAFVRSPHAHARIVSVDTEAARKAKGVLAVLTAADMKEAGVGSIVAPSADRGPRRRKDGDAVPPGARRRQGDACRRSRWRWWSRKRSALAQDAAELVEVDYEELTPVVDLDATR